MIDGSSPAIGGVCEISVDASSSAAKRADGIWPLK